MLPEHQTQDHGAASADGDERCTLAADPSAGWGLVQYDWGLRQGPERASGRLARLVAIVRSTTRCLRSMLRVSIALHAAGRHHTLRTIQL